ncbi:hypothetical protein [Sulfurospirillum arcachonense]|uniref:hypothetical protein n=1 Tax=Sulfurospirillum arcachonense TaxID=57666 RepID=UPI0004680A39|nr:hypothetical protein [Sulfurospirillum arcachonense]
MILSFEFHYISQNALLENMLESICRDFEISYKIGKKENVINLYVKGDEQVLTDFSNFIAQRLPLSIFFKSTAVNVVETIENTMENINECTLCVPYTPKTIFTCQDKDSVLFLNPLINNEVGIATFNAKGVLLKENTTTIIDANETKSFDTLYDEVSKLVSSGEEVYINSASGSYVIGKIDESFKEKKDFIVIPTDLSVVEKMVVCRENEIKALASLEKPTIKFKVNLLYSSKDILAENRVKLKLSDELLLQNICERLHRDGIDFIYRDENKSVTCKYALEIDGKFTLLPQVEVCVLENGEILIISGDGYSAPVIKKNLKKFDVAAHAQFASIMQEHNLFDKKVSCFYLSKTNDDVLMHISEKTGMLDLIKFPIDKDIKEIFASISEDEIGQRLLANYKQQFPEFYANALNYQIPDNAPNNIYTIFGLVAVILGISDNIKDGSEKVVELAEDFGGQKGPSIDFLLIDKESIKSDFDILKLIRSSISFKLAGSDDTTLSFGLMEALAFFLSNSSDSCKENLSSEKTLLCGSFFGVRRFAELACKNIQASSKICLNRELPIDN